MIDLRPVLQVVGILLTTLALAMFLPALADLHVGHDDWQVFLGAGFITLFVGMSLFLMNRGGAVVLTVRQAFLMTTLSWVVLAAFAALPFSFAELGLDYADAFFEAMAGLTTTGATVINGLDNAPPGILVWRALLQWMGGIGIIVTAIAIMPMLRIGGMQLFRTESPEQEKSLPRTGRIAASIATIYLSLSVLCFAAYWATGMTPFAAVTHAMTTVSTAGFSIHDSSIGHYDIVEIELVAMVFMLSGAIPFVIYIQAARGQFVPLWRDTQVRWFFGILLTAVAVLTLWRMSGGGLEFWSTLRDVAFNVVAIITTTGYASADFSAWGSLSVVVFLILFMAGGCAGSTAGGLKMFRIHVLAQTLRIQIRKLIQPHGVVVAHYNRARIDESIQQAVTSFFFVFVAGILITGALLAAHGLDFLTSMSAAASAFGNIGPGLGPVIGPASTYASLPDSAKLLLCLGMLLGRLELFTVLVLFSSRFWSE